VRLSANATVGYIGTPAQLDFAPRSGVSWTSGALMVVSNWNNSGNTRLFFGTDASGLSASQLAQIQFSNPGGFAPGIYSAKISNTGEVVPDQVQGQGTAPDVNSWTRATSGNWDDASSWSLGILPDRSQSVMITNSGWKAVAINPSTPINFPDSMTVSNLTIQGATNTENTLLLNSFGAAVPLTVLNGLTLQDDAQILNFDSSLDVRSGAITVTNSQIIQDGGLVRATNATMFLRHSAYYLTNGVFEGGTVWLGLPVAGQFNQYGGTVTISDLEFGISGGGDGGSYALYGGNLNLPGGLKLLADNNAGDSYFQADGTNQTTEVLMEPGIFGGVPAFTLNGGLLADNDVSVIADNFGAVTLNQNGGSHAVTGRLLIAGGAPNGNFVFPATYNLKGGTLSAGVIELDADEGDSLFVQSNGTASAGTVSVHSGGFFSGHNTSVTLAGGTLSCSNFTTVDGGGTFNQSGGALVVSNLLDFGGSRDTGGRVIFGHYTFTGGTVTASNINLTGVWIIGDGSVNRISNPGFFRLAHTLQINNAVEQLGRFILASNATINLAGNPSWLTFKNSSGETWGAGATLVVTNWNGTPGGGGAEQLKFGSDRSGLTPAQLGQIQFQIGTNSYSAKILDNGEVIPDQVIRPTVTFSTQGNDFVLSWPSGWSLQTATNAAGPYSDVQGATSPHTNNMTLDQQRFFRLRQ
jgi:hypothetical protein